ncbi:MAG TPA: efflux RND transporter permease subunit [Rhizomicrobium sp.]|nr:efflux RND transporter permease subunit [Rhizomicrobium sp.]
MNISRGCIERPVMTSLLMAAMVIFGAFGYVNLPVSDLPNFDFPTITVNASLPGADPETVASAVASPLENQLSTIQGIDSMTSSSSQGRTNISIQFSLDRDIDSAAQDVQTAISAATRQLPRAMPSPPTFRKQNPADLPIIFFALSSSTMEPSKLNEYAETLLARQLSTIQGVAQVQVGGSKKFAVRIQADPSALAARNIGFDTLVSAVNNANVNQATGALNQGTKAAIIHADGQLNNAEEFRRQIIAYRGGAPVRIGDVATVVDSVENPNGQSWYKGKPAVTLFVWRQPGTNTVETIQRIRDVLPQFQLTLPPSVNLEIIYDRSITIQKAIMDVQMTLLIAGCLVVLVIFAFLRRASATLIPSMALPITVIGTFAGMSLMGFNLDNLSLMALTLSVGFVVDDAIVMLENIVRHIEKGMKPYEAAIQGSSEIGFTILSMTVSLAAVFIPILFMGGIVGRLLNEFAVTIIIAIVCSGIVSVTLTPMLCARWLKDEHGETHGPVYRAMENAFNGMQNTYARTLQWSLGRKPVIVGIFAFTLFASYGLYQIMPQDFLPSDDVSRLNGQVQAANGTSFEDMANYMGQVQRIIHAHPAVEGAMAQIDGGNGDAGTSTGRLNIIVLKPQDQREQSADEVIRELRPQLSRIPGVNVFLTNPPAVRLGGRMSRSNYQYTLQGLDLAQVEKASLRLMAEMRQNGAFTDITSDFDAAMPSVQVDIDRDRAAAMGVTPQQIENALGSAFSSGQISQINAPSNQYQVILELKPEYRRDPEALGKLYITANNGTLVPLTSVTRITSGTMALSVNHAGQIPSVTISFDMAAGYALSDAVRGIEEAGLAAQIPETVTGKFQGTAAAFQSSTQNMTILLLMAMVVVYIILGILYESFVHPLTILSGLPSAAMGAMLTLWIFGVPLTLYAFVGMIMLIGIVKKNAIMMIDFALTKQRATPGVTSEEAIYEAAITRFRPIMMTTFAALMGTLPIALGHGAGAESRRPLGLCVAGGLLLSQLLTLYITPVIYTYLDKLASKRPARTSPAAVPAE